MLCALLEFRVRGLETNISFLTKLLAHPTFAEGGKVWTTFIDDVPELLKSSASGNRGQKLLRYLGELVINGPQVAGQCGFPLLEDDIVVSKADTLISVNLSEPCKKGWRYVLEKEGPKVSNIIRFRVFAKRLENIAVCYLWILPGAMRIKVFLRLV